MIGAFVHSRSVAGHLDPVAVGQQEVDDRGVRRMQRREVERLLRRGRGHRLEAGVAQHDAQRPQDLRLVVDDEHAPARRAHPTGAGTGAVGNSTTNVVPCPGRDSTAIVPPFASTKPRAIASPRPDPRWPDRSVPDR